MLLRVADNVPVVDMTGIIEFGGIWKKRGRVFGAPSFWGFRMYSNADASQPVETRTQVEKYNIEQGSVRLPSIPDVPYLDVVAALNDTQDKLILFGVNRHLTQDITARISIAGLLRKRLAACKRSLPSASMIRTTKLTPSLWCHRRVAVTAGSEAGAHVRS